MSEIEKMYENAGIEPERQDCCKIADKYWANATESGFDYLMQKECPYNQECTDECEYAYDKVVYPPFTAEKQLELIKTLETKCDYIDCVQIVYRPMENLWKITIIPVLEMSFEKMYLYFGCDKDFSTALAMAINNLWQDLTEKEKQQVKGILE